MAQADPRNPKLADYLFEALRDGDAFNRYQTILALAEIAPAQPRVVPALLGMLQDKESMCRTTVMKVLHWLPTKDKAWVPALTKALEVADIRSQAALLLGQLGPQAAAAVPALARAAADKQDRDGRLQAAHALLRIGTSGSPSRRELMGVLTETLKDEKFPVVQARAAEALWSLRQGTRQADPAEELAVLFKLLAPAQAAKNIEARNEAAAMVLRHFSSERFAPQVIPALIASLQVSEENQRCHTILEPSRTLVEVLVRQGPRAIPHLAVAVASRNEYVSDGGAQALNRIDRDWPRRVSVPELRKLASDDGKLATRLLAALRRRHGGSRAAAKVLALLPAKDKTWIPVLVNGLKEPHLRKEVAILLGQMGPQAAEAVPELVKGLEVKRDDEYRLRVVQALLQIGNIPGHSRTELAGILQAALKDDSKPLLQARAAEICWSLQQGSRSPDPRVELAVLIKLVSPPKASWTYDGRQARNEAARLLGRCFPGKQFEDQVIPALIKSLQVPDEESQYARWTGNCTQVKITNPVVIEVLARQGQGAMPYLERAVSNANPFVSKGASIALQTISSEAPGRASVK